MAKAKHSPLRTKTVTSFGALAAEIDALKKKGYWVFRGQCEFDWPLRTSLERACLDYHGRLAAARDVERAIEREFRRRLHHYIADVPSSDDALEWWSTMRHHGAPTRLLDFSYSWYIALYFAIEYATGQPPAGLWCLNLNWLMDACEMIPPFRGVDQNTYWLRNPLKNEYDSGRFSALFTQQEQSLFVCHASPFRLNERLTIQRGMFVVPGSVSHSFMENLQALPVKSGENPGVLFRLRFGRVERRNLLKELHDMGISQGSLYPGLDGFSRSLGIHQPTVFKADEFRTA